MLARRSKLTHSGMDFDLPMLIPSFSSKGSAYEEEKKKGKKSRRQYAVAGDLRDFGRLPGKALLVSAFDLHFKHLDVKDKDQPTVTARASLRNASIVFIDSGGYELADTFDSCEPKVVEHALPDDWDKYNESTYRKVLQTLANDEAFPPLVIANFDHGNKGKQVADQVTAAMRLFVDFRSCLGSFIIKPWKKRIVVDPSAFTDEDIASLRPFDVVGVTEKELGANLWERLKRIACLRLKLDRGGVEAPLQVWGGLDPVVTPLYFFAGAALFDGLSWLRYGFANGVALSRHGYEVLEPRLSITHGGARARGSMTLYNRTALDKVELALQSWVDHDGKDWSMFDLGVRNALRDAYEAMQTQIEGVRA